jgi:hypothetical protein
VRAEHPEVGLHPLVVVLDLPLGLQMVCGGELWLNPESLVQALRESSGEGRPSIHSMKQQDSMKFPYVPDVQSHEVWGGDIGGCRNEVHHFPKSVRDNIDHIETTGFGELSYEIQLDPLPQAIGCRDWLHFPELALVPMFHPLAHMASFHIAFDPVL